MKTSPLISLDYDRVDRVALWRVQFDGQVKLGQHRRLLRVVAPSVSDSVKLNLITQLVDTSIGL